MRLRLVGYSGERPPVPGTEVVGPNDPGPVVDPPPDPDQIPPPLTLVLNDGDEFRKTTYLAQGYNRFDVMCIGGAGGRAGRIVETIPDSLYQYDNPNYSGHVYFNTHRYIIGGAGGGGGVHRMRGRLALLPTTIPIRVGAPGADGADSNPVLAFHDWVANFVGLPGGYVMRYPDPTPIPPGGDGGASCFGTVCSASGGKGGSSFAGGEGGIGNRLDAGGAGSPAIPSSGGPGGGATRYTTRSGVWDGRIGSGGAGGSGYGFIDGPFIMGPAGASTWYTFGPRNRYIDNSGAGGAGALSTDHSVESLVPAPVVNLVPLLRLYKDGNGAYYPVVDPGSSEYPWYVLPIPGGGAKAFLLNGDSRPFGTKASGSDGRGLVIVRLTYAIV